MKGTGRERGFACGFRDAGVAVIKAKDGPVGVYISEGARRLSYRLRRGLAVACGILAALSALLLLHRRKR